MTDTNKHEPVKRIVGRRAFLECSVCHEEWPCTTVFDTPSRLAEQDQRGAFIDEAVREHYAMGDELWAVWVMTRLRLLPEKDLVIIAARAIGALTLEDLND